MAPQGPALLDGGQRTLLMTVSNRRLALDYCVCYDDWERLLRPSNSTVLKHVAVLGGSERTLKLTRYGIIR